MPSNIVQSIIDHLIETNLTISTCESMTGGLIASQLTSIENSSKTFKMGFVTYSNESKNLLVNVPNDILKKYGAISEEVAKAMAIGTMKIAQTDIIISITGNASTTNPMENKQSGLSYICIIVLNRVHEYKFIAKSTVRDNIRAETTSFVLNELWKIIRVLKK